MRSSCLSVSAMGMPMRSRSVVKVVLLLTMGASPAAALLTQVPQPRALPHAGITRPHTPVLSSLRPQLQLPNARASTLRMSSKPEPTKPGESFQLYPYRWVQLGYLSKLGPDKSFANFSPKFVGRAQRAKFREIPRGRRSEAAKFSLPRFRFSVGLGSERSRSGARTCLTRDGCDRTPQSKSRDFSGPR